MSNDPIAAAIATAQNAAQGVVNQQALAAQAQAPVSAPAVLTPGRPITMGLIKSTKGVTVDLWLKVGHFGITVGKEKDLIDEIKGTINMKEVKPFIGVRYGGSSPVYNHSFDGVVAARSGKPWADVMAEAYRVEAGNPKFKGEYFGVEGVIIPDEDVLNAKKDKVLAKAGKRLGFSTGIMNFKDWESFYSEAEELGLHETKVRLTLGFEAMDYNGKWGKFTFSTPEAA